MDALYLSKLPDNFNEVDELISVYINQPYNIIIRMEWMGALELIFPKSLYKEVRQGIQDLLKIGEMQGEILDNHLLYIDPDDEIVRCRNIINDLNQEDDPCIVHDCHLLISYYASILDTLKWTVEETGEVPINQIKILSRTIFVSRLGKASLEEVRMVFQQFGYIDKMDYDVGKRRCFIKYRYRRAVEAAMNANVRINKQSILIRYAWPFGPQDDFDYELGFSISKISRLTELDQHMLISKHGGLTEPFRGGVTVEEPFIHTFKNQEYPLKDDFIVLQRKFKSLNWHSSTTITILSRSLYIGNIEKTNKYDLYAFFNKYASIESMDYKPQSGCCFLKLKTRQMTETLMKQCHLCIYNGGILKIGYACGYFGNKSNFDYKNGVNKIPFHKLNEFEQKYVQQNKLSSVCEEPSIYKNK